MNVKADSGYRPRARLDVTTWTFHPEPPSAVDADLDRKTDRLFTAARAFQWATAVFSVGFLLPALFDLVDLPLIALAGGVFAFAASVVTGLRHQKLRKRTGLPVVPALEETLEPFATMMSASRETYELALEDDPAECSHEEAQNLRELQSAAQKAMTAQRKITRVLSRQFTMHCELAAQADRRGWTWLRKRHARAVANLVLQVTSRQASATADGAEQD